MHHKNYWGVNRALVQNKRNLRKEDGSYTKTYKKMHIHLFEKYSPAVDRKDDNIVRRVTEYNTEYWEIEEIEIYDEEVREIITSLKKEDRSERNW